MISRIKNATIQRQRSENPVQVINAVEDYLRDHNFEKGSKTSTDEIKNIFDRLRNLMKLQGEKKILTKLSLDQMILLKRLQNYKRRQCATYVKL